MAADTVLCGMDDGAVRRSAASWNAPGGTVFPKKQELRSYRPTKKAGRVSRSMHRITLVHRRRDRERDMATVRGNRRDDEAPNAVFAGDGSTLAYASRRPQFWAVNNLEYGGP
jgi:hypothetical protein